MLDDAVLVAEDVGLHPVANPGSPGDMIVLHAPVLDRDGARVGVIDATFVTTARVRGATAASS